MKLTTQNIYDFYYPSQCERRLFYCFTGEEEAPPGPFEQVLFGLGKRHEKNHINSLAEYVDVSKVLRDQQAKKTIELIKGNTPIIYQGVLVSDEIINGSQVNITGIPDIIIREGPSYVIRDCKLARHVDEERHPEILAQLQIYGYLYERNTEKKPVKLEALLGDSSIVEIPYDRDAAIKILKGIIRHNFFNRYTLFPGRLVKMPGLWFWQNMLGRICEK